MTLQSRVTVAVGHGGLPPCLDRFQAGRLAHDELDWTLPCESSVHGVSREMSPKR